MRKIFRCRGSGGKDADNLVDLGQLQARIDHAVATGEAQHAAGVLELGVAADNRADGGAVNVRDAGEIKNRTGLVAAKKIFHFLLDAAAIRASVNASAQRQNRDAVLELSFGDFENHCVDSLRTGKFKLDGEMPPDVYEETGGSSPS